jgi:hypothetical protein
MFDNREPEQRQEPSSFESIAWLFLWSAVRGGGVGGCNANSSPVASARMKDRIITGNFSLRVGG